MNINDVVVKKYTVEDIKQHFNHKPIKRFKKYKVIIIGFETPSYMIESFFDNLSLSLGFLGCEVIQISWQEFTDALCASEESSTHFHMATCDFFIGCNTSGLHPTLYDELNTPFISICIDRPYHLPFQRYNGAKQAIYTWNSQTDVPFAKELYFKDGTHFLLPHAAELNLDLNLIFDNDRPLDVVVSCHYSHLNQIDLLDKEKIHFDLYLLHEVEKHFLFSNQPFEVSVETILRQHFIDYNEQMFLQFISETGIAIDTQVRYYQRYQVVEALVLAGLNVHCFGLDWSQTELVKYSNFNYYGEVFCEPGRILFEHTKILINILPKYSTGTHERIFSSMIRGALCFTNANAYLESMFAENEEIVFYDFDNLDDLVRKIKYYLSSENESERLQITKNAFEKVKNHHTWINRAEEILSIYESYIQNQLSIQ